MDLVHRWAFLSFCGSLLPGLWQKVQSSVISTSSGRLLGSEVMMRAVPLTGWKMISMLYLVIS